MSKSNANYWRERFKELETLTYNKSQEYYDRIIKAFNITENKLKQVLNEFYSRFANLEDISITEAKIVLNSEERAAFRMSVEEYIKFGEENNRHWNPALNNILEEASLKYRITRLEAAFYQFAGEIGKLTSQEVGLLYDLLADTYIDRYYRTAYEIFDYFGVGTSFEMIDMNKLEMILDQPWAVDGSNFSSRLWSNQAKLTNTLTQALTSACVRGEGYTETTEYLARALGTSKKNAGRLVVTESAYFASRAQQSCFEELGAEKFMIVATLDNITDPECQDLDGQIHTMDEYEVGVTAPPYHPNCRCTTRPYFEDENVPGYVEGTRTARDPGGKTYRVPRNMTYKEWRKKYGIDPKYGVTPDLKEINNSITPILESPVNPSKIGSNPIQLGSSNPTGLLTDTYPVTEGFRNGQFTRKLKTGKQKEHIYGTKEYLNRLKNDKARGNPRLPSLLFGTEEEIDELIKSKIGTGHLEITANGKWTGSEIVEFDRVIGLNYGTVYSETKIAKIHYGKNGYHMVPMYDETGRIIRDDGTVEEQHHEGNE